MIFDLRVGRDDIPARLPIDTSGVPVKRNDKWR